MEGRNGTCPHASVFVKQAQSHRELQPRLLTESSRTVALSLRQMDGADGKKNPITMQQIVLHQDLTDNTQPSYKQEVQLSGLSTSHDLLLSSVISYFTVLFETVAAKRSDGGRGSPVMALTKVIHHINTTIYLMHPQDTDHYTQTRTHTDGQAEIVQTQQRFQRCRKRKMSKRN